MTECNFKALECIGFCFQLTDAEALYYGGQGYFVPALRPSMTFNW